MFLGSDIDFDTLQITVAEKRTTARRALTAMTTGTASRRKAYGTSAS